MAMAMAAPPSLIGPPEVYLQTPTATTSTATSESAATVSDAFMNQMVVNFNTLSSSDYPPMGYTENYSATYLSTGNPCLDFFFHVVPDTPPQSLINRLETAWDHNPLTTLKLVCNLRGVRGTGKSDKEGYYTAALWLHKLHPKTLACNVKPMADFGYFKDLPEILYRILEGPDVRKEAKAKHHVAKAKEKSTRVARRFVRGRPQKTEAPLAAKKRRNPSFRNTGMTRVERKISTAKKALERYNSDPNYRLLHDRISGVFAERLKSDIELLSNGEVRKISLAAKWCPSLDSSYDRFTLLCESIARKVFPRESYPEYEGVEDAHYAYRVRDRLRKEVLVPLHKALELPEVYIGANDWGSIPYNRVASVAMKLYKGKFFKHDKERFEEYLEKVQSGKAKIAAGALLPHEIIAALCDDDGGQVAELQWRRMVEDLSQKGKFNNCLAICDVSGSMSGTPMDVSVALGVLVSELSQEPWKGKLITFSENPKLQFVQGEDLRSKTKFVRSMEWGMNTDFQKVFDAILQVAVRGKLTAEQMIKRLFVFSDMEFDQASIRPWETDYKVIVRKFEERGYGNCVPEIVFWNLRDSKATPVPSNQPGVALVSGFSKNLLTLFLEDNGVLHPEAVMEAAISGEEYKELVVVD